MSSTKEPPNTKAKGFAWKPDAVDFLHVPKQRRLQTAAVIAWGMLVPGSLATFFFFCSVPLFWPAVIAYIFWVFVLDTSPEHGGRPSKWMRGLSLWKHFAAYYPQQLIKSEDLPPDRPYLFGYHPHGIIGMGAFATFGTEGTGFTSKFPGITPHLLTLSNNFHLPIHRDILLSLGVCSVSKNSCNNILSMGAGSSITIVVGGAAESLYAIPGTADLTLKKRLGFIKIAVQHGASLVPVFAFGENNLFSQLKNEKGSMIHTVQTRFQALFGFTLPLFHGRGLFTYNFGVLPFRHPIVSVVGRPIHTKKNPQPTKGEVEHYQELYIKELMRIWNAYKDVFAKERIKELVLVA